MASAAAGTPLPFSPLVMLLLELLVFWLVSPALVLLHEAAHAFAATTAAYALQQMPGAGRQQPAASNLRTTIDVCKYTIP